MLPDCATTFQFKPYSEAARRKGQKRESVGLAAQFPEERKKLARRSLVTQSVQEKIHEIITRCDRYVCFRETLHTLGDRCTLALVYEDCVSSIRERTGSAEG